MMKRALSFSVAASLAVMLTGRMSMVGAQEDHSPGPAEGAPVSGTWTRLTSYAPAGAGPCLLLTDGTVICQPYGSATWYRLTPDSFGNYVAGTWSPIAPMPAGYIPQDFAAAVLPDGRMIVEGGELNNGVLTETNLGAIYDPAANSWKAVAPPSGWTTIGDAPSVVLANGTFLLGNCCNGRAATLNASTLGWTPAASPLNGTFGEQGFTLLPDGTVLKVDAGSATNASERFDPSTGAWSFAGNTPVRLWSDFPPFTFGEIGPSVLRPDGTVVQFGANASGAGHTGIFDSRTLTWSIGPDFPNGDDASDNPAALLTNGHVLVVGGPGWQNASYYGTSRFYEFDGTSLTQVAAPGGSSCDGVTCNLNPIDLTMLPLPSGQTLVTFGSSEVWVYTPVGSANPAWAPTITARPSVVRPGATYPISGTQFNGLSQAAAWGDNWQMATNYPLVRITNRSTRHVFYARTHGHSTMGVATGSALVSTSFDVPAGIEFGTSDLEVVANGIPSARSTIVVNATGIQPRIAGDFDGDGKADIGVFRPSTGIWYVKRSIDGAGAFTQWGLAGDIPVPGDYDGDGKTDNAVFRPSTGIWYIQNSQDGSLAFLQWGLTGDIPVPGDYDGDGKADAAVFRPSTGIWYVRDLATNTASFYQWGLNGDIPVAADYNGDGKTDVAVFRPSTGIWYIRNSSDNSTAFLQWGITGDVPVPGDYDGDGKADSAVFRPSTNIWYVRNLSTNTASFYQWGLAGDIQAPGDYDGDGKTDVAVFRPSTGMFYIWYVGSGTFAFYNWGLSGDIPVLRR